MGRKIEMKKIRNNTRRQVTFSKRRTNLLRKVAETSILCDVDVGIVAFSSAGRISQFSNRERIEDLLDRYVNLPTEKRLSHMKNVQEKMAKLQNLCFMANEDDKLHYLNDQIKNLESKLEKDQRELKLAEANLRDFELNPAQEPSLHQLLWCERNLQESIGKVTAKKEGKVVMENSGAMPWLNYQGGSGQFAGRLQMQVEFEAPKNDPFMYPQNIFYEMLGKGNGMMADANGGSVTAVNNTTVTAPIPTSFGNIQLFGPEQQVNPNNNSYPQPYQQNQDSYMAWTEAPMQWQPTEPNSWVENFAGESSNFNESYLPNNYPSGFPESDFDPSNFWEMPILENEPNMTIDQMAIDKEEGNGSFNNEMVLSEPPLSVEAPPSMTSGVASDFSYFFPSEDLLADGAWIQNLCC